MSAQVAGHDVALAPAPAKERVRDARIDATKALAIVLVVLGHAKGIPQAFTILVYSFHVPLFFFLSGWVGAAYGSARPGAQAWLKLVRTLLVPYLCFFALGYAYWLLTRNIGEKAARWGSHPWWEPLYGLVSGIGPELYVQPALWFLPALFVTTLAYLYLRRLMSPGWMALLAGVVSLAWIGWFPALNVRLPFALDVLPVSLFFFAAGALGARAGWLLPRTPAGNAIALAVLMLPWLVIAWRNGRIDINMLVFGQSHLAFYIAALLGTAMSLCAARLLQHLGWVQWIGRNTLLILCTHLLVFFVLSGAMALVGGFGPAGPGPVWALFVSVFALLASVPMRWVLMRWAPWSLGARASPRGALR
ncbi:MAG TPA: polysaccharide biosynthesis protein GumF [Xanthomonadaceae bacterium]|nr:polysaccharide biosynthesis protein GumF [Xanthomonadaceae bacterium]